MNMGPGIKSDCFGLKIRLGLFTAIASSLVLVSGIAESVTAQENPRQNSAEQAAQEAANQPTIPDELDDTFFTFDENFYQNHRFPRNAFWLFGSYPENEIAGDGRVVNKLYNQLIRQQGTSDPTIRTADLPNPFSSSLQTDEIYTEEAVPPAPISPSFRQQSVAPTSVEAAPTREAPVPALW